MELFVQFQLSPGHSYYNFFPISRSHTPNVIQHRKQPRYYQLWILRDAFGEIVITKVKISFASSDVQGSRKKTRVDLKQQFVFFIYVKSFDP